MCRMLRMVLSMEVALGVLSGQPERPPGPPPVFTFAAQATFVSFFEGLFFFGECLAAGFCHVDLFIVPNLFWDSQADQITSDLV